ncbi:MAG: MlaD family protein [Bacteroidales bacterium]|nr:MlaD family protein [Bacteroidales bacterium]
MKLKKEAKVGIIAVTIITFSIWGYNFLKGKNLLSNNAIYYAIYNNIDGLEEASPVTVSGFKIGIVESIKLHKDRQNKIIVKFSVKEKVKLPKGSKAIIVSESILAGKALKIEFSDSKQYHSSKDTINGSLEKDILSDISNELLPVKNKIEHLVVSIDSVLSIFDTKRKNSLKESLDNINKITTNFNQLLDPRNSKLSKMLANIESITNNLNKNNQQITNILNNFSNISDSLNQGNLKNTLLNANKTLTEFSQIAQKINKGEGSIGLLVNNDSLYYNLNSLASNIDSLVIDLNKNPKRYVHFSLFGKKSK